MSYTLFSGVVAARRAEATTTSPILDVCASVEIKPTSDTTLAGRVNPFDFNQASRLRPTLGRSFGFGHILTEHPGALQLKQRLCGASMGFGGGRDVPNVPCTTRGRARGRGEEYVERVVRAGYDPATETKRLGTMQGPRQKVRWLANQVLALV